MSSSFNRLRTFSSRTVETRHGRIGGIDEGGVTCFRGVRYGQSTGGANRFRPPVPPTAWAGVQDATEWGNSAPQKLPAAYFEPFYSWYSEIREISEDCLFLNVFSPATNGGRRPVMVWLHGGGWRYFSSTSPGTDGSFLAKAEDVVVVSMNHRLGALGFMALGQDDERFADAGNVGLLDIVLALKWVRDNIAAFGGDPDNVTIFGQSGGGAKVAALMAMPAARGLFHRAIVQSSSGGLRIAGREEAEQYSFDLARTLGHDRPDPKRLQSLPLSEFLAALDRCPRYFRPVIDGRTFEGDPFYPEAPMLSGGIPLMAGCTNTETTYYLRRNAANFALDLDEVKARLARFLKVGETAVGRIIEVYRDAIPSAQPTDILVAVTTDHLFKRNTYRMASLRDGLPAPSYAFVFACESPVDGGILRSPHTSELPFIFGTTEAAQALVGVGSHIEPMTRLMMAVWATFARNGDPACGLVPSWRPYADRDRPVMALMPESALLENPGGVARSVLDELPPYEYSQSRAEFW